MSYATAWKRTAVPGKEGKPVRRKKAVEGWEFPTNRFHKVAKFQHARVRVFHQPEKSFYKTTLVGVKSIQRFGKFSSLIGFIGSIPFEWDERRQKFIEEDRKGLGKIWIFVTGYQFINTLYLVLSLALMVKRNIVETFKLHTVHFAFTIANAFGTILNLNLYVNKLKIIYFLNQFIKVMYMFEREEVQKVVKPTRFEKWLYLFFLAACAQIPMGVTLHFRRPFATYYMMTSFVSPDWFHYPFHVLSLALETWMYTSQWFKVIFFIVYVYTYLLMISSWIKNVKKEIAKSPRLVHLIRYRVLQLFSGDFNDSMSDLVVCGHKVLIIVVTVSSSYVLIHCYHFQLYVYISYGLLFAMVVLFQYRAYPLASAVYKNSAKIHKIFLVRKPLYEYQRRFLKSCAPLKIQVGPFYYFSPYTPLKFFKMESTYTMKFHYYILGVKIGHLS